MNQMNQLNRPLTISIPTNGKYSIAAHIWLSVKLFHFNNYKLNSNPNSAKYWIIDEYIQLDNALKILGFNINPTKLEIEIPIGIIISLKIKRSQVNDSIQMNVAKSNNKGMEPFRLQGSSERFEGIQLLPV